MPRWCTHVLHGALGMLLSHWQYLVQAGLTTVLVAKPHIAPAAVHTQDLAPSYVLKAYM